MSSAGSSNLNQRYNSPSIKSHMEPPTFANQRHNPLFIEVSGSQSHYTCGDRVEGLIRVDPTTRPRHVSIIFKGFSILNETHANATKPTLFEFAQDLFVSTGTGENFDILKRGTADDGKVELPFNFTFPHSVVCPPPPDRSWWYPLDNYNHPRFQHSPGFLLPPSCAPIAHGTNGLLAPKVIYHLEARVDLHLVVRHQLAFVPSAPDYPTALLQPDTNFSQRLPKHCCRYRFIRTRKLLPGYGHSSKLGKLKDVLVDKELFFGIASYSEVPYAKFNLFATPARILVIGACVPIVVTIQHLERSQSLPSPPDLYLRRVRVQLISALNVFVPNKKTARKGSRDVVDVGKGIITLFDKKFEKGDEEPLISGLNLLDIGDVRLPNERIFIFPSFTSYGLAMEYELQVEIWGGCVDREFSGIVCREQVQIVTDRHVPDPNRGVDELLEAEPRPEYQELDPMAVHEFGDIARPYEPPTHNVVQESGAFIPAYEPEPGFVPMQTVSRAVPPPPYAG